MKKRIISLLVVLSLMVTAIVPTIFADSEDAATYDSVSQALGEAVEQEAQAGLAAAAVGETGDAFRQAIAAANELIADRRLDKAEAAENIGEAIVENRADYADRDAKIGGAFAQDAKESRNDAIEADLEAIKDRKAAEEARDVAETTDSYIVAGQAAEDAEAAAQEAKENAIVATNEAGQATFDAFIAQAAANDAQLKYAEAKAAYEFTAAYVKDQLEKGLISAEEAEKQTAAALAEAEKLYADAKKAAEDAAAETEKAQGVLDDARNELTQDIQDLKTIVAEGALTVAKDTAVTAVTGAVLAVADIAKDLADRKVEDYENQIEDVKEQIEALNAALADADQKIAELEQKIIAGEGDADELNKALEAAKAARDAAQAVAENAQAVKAAREIALRDGSAEQMQNIQDSIKAGTATDDDITAITKLILENLNEYDENLDKLYNVSPVDGQPGIFSYTDKDGNTIGYFKAVTEGEEGEKYLQFYPQNKATVEERVTSNFKNESYSILLSTSGNLYVGEDAEGNKYDIFIKRSGWGTGLFPYEYTLLTTGLTEVKFDDDGVPYIEKQVQTGTKTVHHDVYLGHIKVREYDEEVAVYETRKFSLTLTRDGKPVSEYMDSEGTSYDSNFISDKWAAADDADENLKQASDAVEAAKKEYDNKVEEIQDLTDNLTKLQQNNELSNKERKELEEQLKELNKDLNGNLLDAVTRCVISSDWTELAPVEAIQNDLAEITSVTLSVKMKIAEKTQRIAELEDDIEKNSNYLKEAYGIDNPLEVIKSLTSSSADGESVRNLINTVMDGKFDLNDVSSVVEMITGDGIPERTKAVIIGEIQEMADAAHKKAVTQLATDLKKTVEDTIAKGHEIEADTAALLKAKVDYETAKAEEAYAKQKEKIAAAYEKQAKEADDAAKKAVDEYEKLLAAGVDNTDLLRAKAARDAAAKAARDAWRYAGQAQLAAWQARLNAVRARNAADAAYEAYLKLIPHNPSGEIDWAALQAINPDIIGWINIPGTTINSPIVQGKDNEFYLTHNFEGFEDPRGCIFLDTACKPDFSDANSILYGNNFEGVKFSDLVKFLDPAFLGSHTVAEIYSPGRTYNIEIKSAKTLALNDTSYTEQPASGHTLTMATLTNDGAQRVVVTCVIK